MQKKAKVQSSNMFSHTLNVLKDKKVQKTLILSFIITLAVYSFFYGIWTIPFVGFGIMRMSEITFIDYLFVFATSLLIALIISLMRYERMQKSKIDAKSFAGISGVVSGFVASVCPVCQGVVLIGLGNTLASFPLTPIIPYLGILKLTTIGLLLLGLFLKMDSTYTKTCAVCKVIPAKKTSSKKQESKEFILFRSNLALFSFLLIIVVLMINSLLIPKAFVSTSFGTGGSFNLGSFEYGPKMTLKPMPLAEGEQPAIQGYKSKVKSLTTISELAMTPSTGDATQDLLNNVIPKGTPWYGEQAGVNFDDPVGAQNAWQKGLGIQLTDEEQSRWNRIVNSFTCDYCCGSPQNPTIITRCGCAHSKAAQGMAKWFIKYYGNSYSDEEIYGEMARWYSLWYPGPTIKRIIQEAQV